MVGGSCRRAWLFKCYFGKKLLLVFKDIILKFLIVSVLVRSIYDIKIFWGGRLKKEIINGNLVLIFYWVNDF